MDIRFLGLKNTMLNRLNGSSIRITIEDRVRTTKELVESSYFFKNTKYLAALTFLTQQIENLVLKLI